ncbi:MAG: hypothetical protein ACRD0K_23145 [Egibacteraceae bacterium]
MQLWLLVGIPTLVIGLALFLRRSPIRALLGYMVLGAGFGITSVVHRPSAAVFGGLLALLYAAGRGGPMERDDPHLDEQGVPGQALHPLRRRTAPTGISSEPPVATGE